MSTPSGTTKRSTLEAGALELINLDREVRVADERLERARAALIGEDDAAEEARGAARTQRNPLEPSRHVAAQSTYRRLAASESTPAAHERDHRDALLRWVHELLQARIGWELELDDADAVHAADESRPGKKPEAPDPGGPARTYAGAREAWIRAPNAGRAREALARMAVLAPRASAVRKERSARRFEAARRLGLEHPFALALPGGVAQAIGIARAILDLTELLASDVKRRLDPFDVAMARDAREGWPTKLGPRWMSEMFAPLASHARDGAKGGVRFPAALGGASFLRAAASWGAEWRKAGTARSLPFALAHDPHPDDAFRFGDVLALAVADPSFQRKRLGLSTRAATAQARHLRLALLVALREQAARFLLVAASDPMDAFEELTLRVFGAPFAPALAHAWPEPRSEEPARLAGALRSHAFYTDLVERFDEDWYANPGAGSHLAAMACGPVFTREKLDEEAPKKIARAFEEALG